MQQYRQSDGRKKSAGSSILKDQKWWLNIIATWVTLTYVLCYSRCTDVLSLPSGGLPSNTCTSCLAVVNGWLLYHCRMHQERVPQKKHMPLISFQSAIAASLCQAGKTSAGATYIQAHMVGHPQAHQHHLLCPAKKGNHHLWGCQIGSMWSLSCIVDSVKLGTHTFSVANVKYISASHTVTDLL